MLAQIRSIEQFVMQRTTQFSCLPDQDFLFSYLLSGITYCQENGYSERNLKEEDTLAAELYSKDITLQ